MAMEFEIEKVETIPLGVGMGEAPAMGLYEAVLGSLVKRVDALEVRIAELEKKCIGEGQ